MSVARCREINARLRAAGVTVYEWPGWESRGNGQSSAYEGGIIHHTATAFGSTPAVLVDGRKDLAGPLCNYAGNADGSVTVIAAHPANHAGASGGKSMGPLPVTSTFNKRVLGLEIVYPGTAPMRTAQYRTALIWARVVADVVGHGDIQRIRAHAETSITGKWDPGDAPSRTINMAAFRAATQPQPPPPPPAPPKEDIDMRFVRGDSKTPVPGQTYTFGDIVFKVVWPDTVGALAVRARVTNPDDAGYKVALKTGAGMDPATGKPWVLPQAEVDGILDAAPQPPVQVDLDYDQFVTDVVDRLAAQLSATGVSLSEAEIDVIAAATVREFKKEGN
jgi:hypothetical protein